MFSPVPGIVMVSGDIITGSTLRGILAIVYADGPNFNNIASYRYIPNNRSQPGVYSMDVDLPSGRYQVSVFVVQEDQRPFLRAAASPESTFIKGTGAMVTILLY